MARRIAPIHPDQRYVSPRQAARALGVSEYLIYKGVAAGDIPCRRLGERILIPRDWVESDSPAETARMAPPSSS